MTMYLVGGGPDENVAAVWDGFVAEARGRGTRIAIALLGSPEQAAGRLAQYADPLTERFAEASIEPVWLTDEGEVAWPEDPQELAGLVVAGGWIRGYLESIAPFRESIARLIRSGTPYLGFSAGAMIVAKHAIVGGWRYQGRQVAPEIAGEGSAELSIEEGLGLIGVSIETHATSHAMLTRAVAALQAGPMSSIAVIDDDAALVIEVGSGRTSVLGGGQVTWLSRRGGEVVVHLNTGEAQTGASTRDDDPLVAF